MTLGGRAIQEVTVPFEHKGWLRGNAYVYWTAFVASIGGFLFGYDLAIIVGANTLLRDQFNLSPSGYSFATMSAALGCVSGPFLASWLCDRIGRKMTMIVGAVLLAVNSVMTALAPDMIIFNIFRILGGVGVGLCSMASPMYIAEIAPFSIRGKLGLMYQIAIVIGSQIAGLVAYFLARELPDTISWRWMFASEMVSISLFMVFLIPIPRSPRWLAEKGRFEDALKVLTRIMGVEQAKTALQEIRTSHVVERATIGEIFRPGLRTALLIGLLLAFFNNFTGWSAMSGYLTDLFQRSGFLATSDAIFQFFLAYSFMGVVTLGAMGIIDRFGRRPLWLFSSALMVIAMTLIGLLFHYQTRGVIVLLAVFLCAIPHSLALGPLPWLMMSEIFPTRLRAKAVSVTTTFLWLTIFTGGFIFPILMRLSERLVGSVGGAFWFLAVICVFSFIFGLKLLPETKGKTLEEIAARWYKTGLEGKKKPAGESLEPEY
jgi:MFS transporter, SP family, arabinose:H+ symporter